ncbi:hypothetical protein CY34DRAFT_805808 [Suillus luteus UH-Slu-Lm8-n1]|uniref:Unplaced genomic scaffold CY34scaffold_131, whole genome shotgun sequence n=1 Tax=Suillus luteus UH-Slu-Lm8-n1 TaxID=930992 RepID=A0A0D0AUM7_9AGAM|nr:hypothetical protein CY34DRAFT_805808 [Suillus luteus UH-Slu-Lm8-n1]
MPKRKKYTTRSIELGCPTGIAYNVHFTRIMSMLGRAVFYLLSIKLAREGWDWGGGIY